MWTLLGASLPFALPGHVALWTSFWNHTQAAYRPRWLLRGSGRFAVAACGLLPLYVWVALSRRWQFHGSLAACYLLFCGATGIVTLARLLLGSLGRKPCPLLLRRTSVVHSLAVAAGPPRRTASRWGQLQLSFPGNQALELEVAELEVVIPRLPDELDRLSIAHLSDLHFTGKVDRNCFDQVVDRVNDMQADLIAITGDLVDDARYLPWIPATLGRLAAPHGVFGILGNHDLKQDLRQLRLLLGEAGIVSLGGRWEERLVRNGRIVLAGNELPWIAPATETNELPDRLGQPHVRILLAHSPDQFAWGRANDFDIVLAGHTHGGQFCLPGLGPVISPSAVPLESVSGLTYATPSLLHVSRGVSGETPIRLNCRPEITKLVFRSAAATAGRTQKCAAIRRAAGEIIA